jgi:Ca-activated chloride channel family protein
MTRPCLRVPGYILFFISFMLFSARPLCAQQIPSGSNELVNIPFTLIDKDRHFVSTLHKEDICLLDDGVPQEVIAFQKRTDQPLSLVITIDTSISQERTLPNQKIAATTFVDSIIRQSKDQAAIITFSDHATLEQTLTSDIIQLRQAISGIEFKPPPGYLGRGQYTVGPPIQKKNQPASPGSTAIWDAVWATSDKLLSQTPEMTRRAIILITDGQDTGSLRKMNESVDRALKANVVIYAIGIGDEYYDGVDKGSLQKLAERTGGHAFVPKTWDELRAIFESIEQELNSQYMITYSSTNKKIGNEIRKVRIEIVNPELRKQGLQLAYQQGYFSKGR